MAAHAELRSEHQPSRRRILGTHTLRWCLTTEDLRARGFHSLVPRGPVSQFRRHLLPRISALIGVALGVGIIFLTCAFLGPGGRLYWQDTVTVPANDNATHPYDATFEGAKFSMWWPPAPQGPSTGLQGVRIQITEPSGVLDTTGTWCGSCGDGLQSWYSSDGDVGIAYTDGSLGTVTLLVAA
jgi:hypothetical protein